jgi:hypothetical protein
MGMITDIIESSITTNGVGHFNFKNLPSEIVDLILSIDDKQRRSYYLYSTIPYQVLLFVDGYMIQFLETIPRKGMKRLLYADRMWSIACNNNAPKKMRKIAICLHYDAISDHLV